MSSIYTNEYLVWGNCNNRCKFCWQKKKADPNVLLTEDEKVKSIDKCIEHVTKQTDVVDVLYVGGEIFGHNSEKVNAKIKELMKITAYKCRQDEIRYMYLNTNLLWEDFTNFEDMIEAFDGIEDRIKFTTSYDIEGRFEWWKWLDTGVVESPSKDLFLKNIKYIASTYPKLNVVVNTIMTSHFYDLYVVKNGYSLKEFIEETGAKFVHLLPYIAPTDYGSFNLDWSHIKECLLKADKEYPGYLENYIINFDENQNKILYEYHKDVNDYVECTAKYGECGHNINFKKVLPSSLDICYICALKEAFLE